MRIALNACLVVLLFVFTGCGSITSRWRGERAAYAGVRFDHDCLTHPIVGEEFILPVAAVDLPLSAVLDTFFLPYDLTGETRHEERSEPPSETLATGRVGYAR
jgi:uncharacterized protein YceK